MKWSKTIPVLLAMMSALTLSSLQAKAQTTVDSDAQTIKATEASAASAETEKFSKALNRYRPVLRFDSGEDFYPLSVSALTNNVGNRLTRDDDRTIAERKPGGKGLNTGYLRGGKEYPNGAAIESSDKVIERHDNKDDYFQDAAKLQSDSRYRDRIYKRLILTRDDGKITGAWLQYWIYYYYNDFPIGPRGGDHEGDWELVQIKLDPLAKPVYAVYSQHDGGSKCVWRKVQTDGLRPIVYVARGSHANYFRKGAHDQDRFIDGMKRRSINHFRPIGNNSPAWLNWPGYWGSTKGTIPKLDADSPKGPKMQKKSWDPDVFAGSVKADDDCND